ncbi:MAG: hypothetical protein KDI79_25130 [Anaerolineae bacterium]|nr:hypothetical protein [Anaerolineae bacterium]
MVPYGDQQWSKLLAPVGLGQVAAGQLLGQADGRPVVLDFEGEAGRGIETDLAWRCWRILRLFCSLWRIVFRSAIRNYEL